MPGGLLNIVAYGAANVILNGNPNKTFFKAVYRKYTNFGLQRFNLNYEGQRNLSFDSETIFDFKIKRYAELLWDTYIVVNLPDIWSPFYPRPDLWTRDPSLNAIPYEFQWIKQLGFNMIKQVTIYSGGTILDQYSGEWMANVIARDEGSKRLLINRMTGNIPQLYDPANVFAREGVYPNAVYDASCVNIEPSIRGRQLFIPLLAWFCFSSKLALPLVSLQYQEIFIRIEFRAIKDLFTIRHVQQPSEDLIYSCPLQPGLPATGLGARKAPNSATISDQLWRFIQPPPAPQPNGAIVNSADGWTNWLADWQQYANKNNEWNTNIHLYSTYVFLGNDERRQFAAKDHQYLVKSQHQHDFHNATGSQRVNIPSNNMVSSYMFRWRRSDVNLRNEWSNYSNWDYQNTYPTTLFGWDPSSSPHLISDTSSTPIFNMSNPMGWLVTGCRNNANIKGILINLGILLGSEYRENTHPAGLYNLIEKYKRTTGDGRDGLYIYNFCIDTNRMVYQPSGAQNTEKWQYVVFEFQTIEPPKLSQECLNATADISIMCDPSGAIIGVRKNIFRLREYSFDLRIFEERYNIILIKSGLIGTMYAR